MKIIYLSQLPRSYVPQDDNLGDNDSKSWKPLNLYMSSDPRYSHVYFLILKPEMEGKRYKIRLINNGRPGIDDHPLDNDRLFAVALLIDGVNSIYQKKDGERGPVVVHPLNASKWVLTAPGRRLVPRPAGMVREVEVGDQKITSKIENGALIEDKGQGHSAIDVLGFQKDADHAQAFVFARPGDCVAESVGIISSVGMITAYIYGERLPPIKRSMAGTKAGKEIESPTFAVRFNICKEPVEVLRVFYRYEDDLPCAREDLVLVGE